MCHFLSFKVIKKILMCTMNIQYIINSKSMMFICHITRILQLFWFYPPAVYVFVFFIWSTKISTIIILLYHLSYALQLCTTHNRKEWHFLFVLFYVITSYQSSLLYHTHIHLHIRLHTLTRCYIHLQSIKGSHLLIKILKEHNWQSTKELITTFHWALTSQSIERYQSRPLEWLLWAELFA